jgi:hypothetical protein
MDLLAKRFNLRLQQKDECLEYTFGATYKGGYRRALFMKEKTGEYWAHRAAWVLDNGPIPEGLKVCHHCDNPVCCNTEHLFLGTPADNTRDMLKKGRDMSGMNAKVGYRKKRERNIAKYGRATL